MQLIVRSRMHDAISTGHARTWRRGRRPRTRSTRLKPGSSYVRDVDCAWLVKALADDLLFEILCQSDHQTERLDRRASERLYLLPNDVMRTFLLI